MLIYIYVPNGLTFLRKHGGYPRGGIANNYKINFFFKILFFNTMGNAGHSRKHLENNVAKSQTFCFADTRRKKLLGYSLSAATIADIRPHEVENITGSAENPPTYSSVVNNPKYTTLPSYAEAKSLRSQPNSISKSTNGDQE